MEINWLAAVVAGIVGFFSGGLWYSKAMFCDAWCKEAGVTMPGPETPPKHHPALVFVQGVILSIVSAVLLAKLLGPAPELLHALKWSAAAGAGFVAAAFGINYGFAQKSVKLWLIDGGYHTVQFTLIGLVLGLWH
jgi:hypothetical protein